jgi:hypothetical protein
MRNSVCWPLLVIVMGYCAVAMAQQPYPDSRFRQPDVEMGRPGQGADAMRYRWRPLEEGNAGEQDQTPSAHGSSTDAYGGAPGADYTDEPFGLPRGTYRRIEERHTIVPHDEGFRFRPLRPEEQERVKERNERNRQSHSESPDMNGRRGDPRFNRMQTPPMFRPDKRFEGGSNGPGGRYSYPEGGQLPQFRPY